ncbi:PadR family transcriptional regulator [Nesterenkonia sp. F]|uniref:PadR family transcriptional regulator n=1 Tax=Nesterenkonia sp. F TaxID=795955 RepID=UPI000255C941|nr:PadR family transcriptional regulator [Nesterenkonia sp. F]
MVDDPSPDWPAPWVRAALSTAVLAALQEEPQHGYGIAVALERRGFGRPRGGSLYPLLGGLEDEGLIAASWADGAGGPRRRVYRLTDPGHRRLQEDRDRWRALVDALGDHPPAPADADEPTDSDEPRSPTPR